MRLQEIAWPVYKIGNIKPQEYEGVLFFLKKDNILEILDDKTLPADTLAGRRLYLLSSKEKLFKLKHAIFFLGDLIKIANSKTWFIDSKGIIFQYTKQEYAKLVFRKITNSIRDISCSLIEVKGFHSRFKILHHPTPEQKWAGILIYKHMYILYGLYEQEYKDTVRKI